MFSLNVNNKSSAMLIASSGDMIKPGTGWGTGGTGDPMYVDGPMGRIGIVDIADTHIPGDSKETWGVLIGYQEMSFVGRYEGQGMLILDVNRFFQVTLSGGMDFRQVSLDGLIVGGATDAA